MSVLDRTVNHGTLCSGPERSNIICKKWNIILHVSWYGVGWIINDFSDHISVMVLLISPRTWTCRKTVSCHSWKSCVLRIMPRYSWTKHRHITHLLLENTWVTFPKIVGLAVGRQCCPLHLTDHIEAQTCDCVTILFGASQGILLHSGHTKPLNNLTGCETPVNPLILRKESYRLCHRLIYFRSWEWWSTNRSTQQ